MLQCDLHPLHLCPHHEHPSVWPRYHGTHEAQAGSPREARSGAGLSPQVTRCEAAQWVHTRGSKHMNRSCGQKEYQVHLYAPRAQLLHLNPSHWDAAPVPQSSRRENSPAPRAAAAASLPALPASVSTCYFFSNPRFPSQNLSHGAHAVWLWEPPAALFCPPRVTRASRCTAVEGPLLQNFNKACTPLSAYEQVYVDAESSFPPQRS